MSEPVFRSIAAIDGAGNGTDRVSERQNMFLEC